jgi:hypothetical protein
VTRNARDVGGRIEELLGGLTASRDRQAAEELVRLLVETYGNALGRIVGILRSHDPALVDELVSDELVESLLLVHDTVRPYLGSHAGGVEYLGVDDGGVARLRLEGNCDGCPSSTLTVHAHGPHRRPAATPTVGRLAADAELGPSTLRPVLVGLDGVPVLLCSLRGTCARTVTRALPAARRWTRPLWRVVVEAGEFSRSAPRR